MTYPRLSSSIALTAAGLAYSCVNARAGVYVLGPAGDAGSIIPKYVGRSDRDLVAGLKRHFGEESHFAYAQSSSVAAAFKAECALFHHLKPPKNTSHPDGPYRCPCCKIRGVIRPAPTILRLVA
jgi:hypothetical protein